MQLIYRGNIYNYTPAPVRPYQKPYALNWRFRVPGETYGEQPLSKLIYRQPHAINWRFRGVSAQ